MTAVDRSTTEDDAGLYEAAHSEPDTDVPSWSDLATDIQADALAARHHTRFRGWDQLATDLENAVAEGQRLTELGRTA